MEEVFDNPLNRTTLEEDKPIKKRTISKKFLWTAAWIFSIVAALLTGMQVGRQNVDTGLSFDMEQIPTNFPNETPTIILSPTPEATPTPTAIAATPTIKSSENELLGWSEYTNPKFKFSLKYPKEWTSSTVGSEVNMWQNFFSPDLATSDSQEPKVTLMADARIFSQKSASKLIDFQKFDETEGITKHYKVNKISEEVTTVGGFTAYKYKFESADPSQPYSFWGLIVSKEGNLIRLSITDFKIDKSTDGQKIAEEMIKSFKFTP